MLKGPTETEALIRCPEELYVHYRFEDYQAFDRVRDSTIDGSQFVWQGKGDQHTVRQAFITYCLNCERWLWVSHVNSRLKYKCGHALFIHSLLSKHK